MTVASPLRIALLTRSLTMGGAQNHILKLCQSIDPAQAEISLFLLIRDESNDLARDLPTHIPVFISPYRRHHPLTLPWLARQLRRQRMQVLHSFLWTADAYAGLLHAFNPGLPLIISERGDRSFPFYASPYRRWIDRAITFKVADHACANSAFGARLLAGLGFPAEKICAIPNGIDLALIDRQPSLDVRAALALPAAAKLVGVTGRLEWIKGGDVLLKALAMLGRTDVACVFLGDGPERSRLQAAAAELGLGAQTFFPGKIYPSLPWVKCFDVAVLPTRTSEHCSNAILEYMACARPVIATSVGGNPELVVDGENGLLVPPEDPSALAQALGRLLADPQSACQMGASGRKRIESHFQMDTISRQFLALWRAALAREAAHA